MGRVRINALGGVDIGTLIALRTVLAEQSVGKAALDIGLSQPAMSNALARLRAAFNDPLLVRTHGKMELTARGQEVLEQLEVILPQLERLAQPPMFDPASAQVHFRIAANDHAAQILTPHLVASLFRAAPRSTLTVTTLQTQELNSEFEDAQFDLRIGWISSAPQTWFIRKLVEDRMVVVVDSANEGLSDPIGVEQFTTLSHIGIRTRPSGEHTGMDKRLHERGLHRHVTVWLSNFSTIPSIVRNSSLLALIPETLARRYQAAVGGIRILQPPAPLDPHILSMAWSPKVHHHPANRWLRALIADTAREYASQILSAAP